MTSPEVMVGRVAPLMSIVDSTVQSVVRQFRNVFGFTARHIHVGVWSDDLQLELYTTVNGGMGSPFGFCCRQCTVMVLLVP